MPILKKHNFSVLAHTADHVAGPLFFLISVAQGIALLQRGCQKLHSGARKVFQKIIYCLFRDAFAKPKKSLTCPTAKTQCCNEVHEVISKRQPPREKKNATFDFRPLKHNDQPRAAQDSARQAQDRLSCACPAYLLW